MDGEDAFDTAKDNLALRRRDHSLGPWFGRVDELSRWSDVDRDQLAQPSDVRALGLVDLTQYLGSLGAVILEFLARWNLDAHTSRATASLASFIAGNRALPL